MTELRWHSLPRESHFRNIRVFYIPMECSSICASRADLLSFHSFKNTLSFSMLNRIESAPTNMPHSASIPMNIGNVGSVRYRSPIRSQLRWNWLSEEEIHAHFCRSQQRTHALRTVYWRPFSRIQRHSWRSCDINRDLVDLDFSVLSTFVLATQRSFSVSNRLKNYSSNNKKINKKRIFTLIWQRLWSFASIFEFIGVFQVKMALKWVSMPILQRSICSATCKSTISAVLMKNMSSSAASAANIGFIGLGNMGGHMTRNLIKKVR